MTPRAVATLISAALGGLALVASLLPISGRECSGSSAPVASSASATPAAPAPLPQVCHETSLVAAFGSAESAAVWLAGLTALTVLPWLLRRWRWPSVVVAAVLAGLFVASFGATLFWLPSTLAAAVGAALPDRPRRPRAA